MSKRTPTMFTPEVMLRVRSMLINGKNGTEIAAELNCSADSLRAACHKYGIALRSTRERMVDDALCIKIILTPEISDLLRIESRIRGRSSKDLAAEIIDAVVGDKLFSAVLDK